MRQVFEEGEKGSEGEEPKGEEQEPPSHYLLSPCYVPDALYPSFLVLKIILLGSPYSPHFRDEEFEA